jgi:hypothetical protein
LNLRILKFARRFVDDKVGVKSDRHEALPAAEKQMGLQTKKKKLKNFKAIAPNISVDRFSGSI